MSWVLDCSMALAFGLPDEQSDVARRFLSSIDERFNTWIPPLWWYEIANAINMAKRRQRISDAQRTRLMELYAALPLRTDIGVGASCFFQYHQIACQYTLSAYDAAYLELASRRGMGLASLDAKLCDAAKQMGITVFE